MPLVPALQAVLHNHCPWRILSTVNCDTSCVPSFVFTMILGCPCKPLRYSFGPISHGHPPCTQPPRASRRSITQQTFHRYGHGIVVHALLLCDQSSLRISATFRRVSPFNLLSIFCSVTNAEDLYVAQAGYHCRANGCISGQIRVCNREVFTHISMRSTGRHVE